jgi:ATP-dependent Clp protease adaptor protein ClpS
MAKDRQTSGSPSSTTQSEPPPKYGVVLLDDDYTPYDWVLKLLNDFFHRSPEEAISLAREIDITGRACVGVYTRDIAETRCMVVHRYSQKAGYPLQARTERQ